MADQALQGAAVTGRGDHGVRARSGRRRRGRPCRPRSRRPRPRSRPGPCGRRRSGRRPARGWSPRCTREYSPVSGRGSPCADRSGHAEPWPSARPAGRPGRPAAVGTRMPGELGGPAGRRAAHDVRRGPHREPYARGAALDEVDGDLGAGVADADDEDVTAGVRARGCGTRRRAGVRPCSASRPGQSGTCGRVVVAGGDDDRAAGQLAPAGGVQQPAARRRRRARRGRPRRPSRSPAGGTRRTSPGTAPRCRATPTVRTSAASAGPGSADSRRVVCRWSRS